jgi:hypothetical protein
VRHVTSTQLKLDPAVKKALRVCAEELDALGADWAIAGATAMQVHGYARATRDVDLFIGDDVRLELIRRLRDRKLSPTAVFSPHHYRVAPAGRRDPEAAIDLLFPALGVESLGLLAAKRERIDGAELPVLPIQHLVALKLTTDPAIDPSRYLRDQADLVALRDRGLVDSTRVAQILEDVGDREARGRLAELVATSRLRTTASAKRSSGPARSTSKKR